MSYEVRTLLLEHFLGNTYFIGDDSKFSRPRGLNDGYGHCHDEYIQTYEVCFDCLV